MNIIILKGIGIYLLAIIESVVIFLAFMLGKWTNGLDIELAIFIGSLLSATQVLIILIIKYFFKLDENSIHI